VKKLPRKTKSNRTAAAAVPQIAAAAPQTFQNAALPTSTGGYRTYPTYQTWGPKKLNEIWRQRDHVQISRFLQDKIPQLGYCIHSLPQEAIGKGIGLKSVSANLDFKIAATALFKAWADSIAVDLRKESTFYKLQSRWLSAILGDGECFTHKIADQSESSRSWKLSDKRKRRLQIQTFLRDQLTNGTLKREDAISTRWMDGVKYNGLDQLELIRINQDTSGNVSSSTTFLDLPASNVHHLKAHLTFGQDHGVPWIFRSNEDLLDALDLKAIRKHSAKIRSALLGATSTRDGKMPNSMQAAQSAEKLGNPATDTGRRFMEIGEGAVMIPLADGFHQLQINR
jgi:capsid protein